VPIDREFKRARQAGIDVNQVGESLARHLSADRQKLRDNPQLLELHQEPRDNLCVAERATPSGVHWETLGELPERVDSIKVSANSWEAAMNKMTLEDLLKLRYRRAYALGLQKAGWSEDGVEGFRKAWQRASRAEIYRADVRGGE
jgi:hypothetical protein